MCPRKWIASLYHTLPNGDFTEEIDAAGKLIKSNHICRCRISNSAAFGEKRLGLAAEPGERKWARKGWRE